MLLQELLILFRHRLRHDLHALGGFNVLKLHRRVGGKVELGRVENVKQDQVVAAELQAAHRRRTRREKGTFIDAFREKRTP